MKIAFPLLAFGLLVMAPLPCPAALPEAEPAEVGLDPGLGDAIDKAVGLAIAERRIPGAVVLVGREGKIAHVQPSGYRSLQPDVEPMTRDTIFDMASLTKPVATATSIMILVERGEIDIKAPITRYMPELDNHGKDQITVEMLLRHRSGLIPDNPLSDYADGPDEAWRRIAEIEPIAEPGSKFLYSDVNFLILGRLVERITGKPLEEFALENIFEPLEMNDTRFLPLEAENPPIDRIAPTEKDGDDWLRGVVHDPRSRALGGVAGHAGLFSTADDLAIFAQTLLNGGDGPNGRRILKAETVRAMIDPADTPEGQRRGLGWDVATGFSSPRGKVFGPGGYGHTGFTGTSLWIDPETRSFVILLTSRLHPDGKAASPIALRSEIATIVGSAIREAGGLHPVQCGIDVLIENGFEGLKGKRVGLVTNHTGRARDGRSTIDVLFQAPEVELVALFSPEHGIRGLLDREVPSGKDEATGLPIHSLYGKTRKPSPESLEGLDVLVFDIQDIGARFYTYISTLGLVLEAARENEVAVMVLDRPNPIGGVEVSGPVRDDAFASFIAHHAMPVRHGMTVGEIARMFNAERKIGADLSVVRCEGWRRADLYDRTGLALDQPLAQHAQSDRGPALSRCRPAGSHEPRHRPGHRYAFRARRGPLDRSGRVLRGVEPARPARSPLRADPVHSDGTPVRGPGMRRRLHHDHRPRPFRPDRPGHRPGRDATEAVSGRVGAGGPPETARRPEDLRRDPRRPVNRGDSRGLARGTPRLPQGSLSLPALSVTATHDGQRFVSSGSGSVTSAK